MNNFNSLPVSGLTVSIVPPGFMGYPLLALITLPSVTVPVNSVELVELNLFCIVVGLLSAYSNETPYYNNTEGTIIGVQNKGIIFPKFSTEFKNSTAVPFQLGPGKSATGASLPDNIANKSIIVSF